MTSSASRRRWPRRVALLGAASLALAADALRRERANGGPPLDRTAQAHPDGESLVITTEDGAELAVTVAGPADGSTVVLSHCWMGSRAIWGRVAQALVDHGHRVVLYDQRGHGASSLGSAALSVAVLGDDLRAVLEAVDATDAVLAGHSMGGMSIQSYIAEHPVDFKDRARGIVLVATAAKTTGRPIPPAIIELMFGEQSSARGRGGALEYAVTRSAFGRRPRRADVELTSDLVARTAGRARAGFLIAMSTMDLHPALASIDVPATVLVGTQDRLTPPRRARSLGAGIAGSRVILLPGAGHMLPLEEPDQVADAIRALAKVG